MSIIAVRSIPISTQTKYAWKDSGVTFARRDRSVESVLGMNYGAVLNLGNTSFITDDERVWNEGTVIRPLVRPADAHALLTNLMPPNEWQGEGFYWEKYTGRAGNGKTRWYLMDERAFDILKERVQWSGGDVQREIAGQEYRAITVGDKVVQVNARHGVNGDRSYTWVGVRNAPAEIKRVAKLAAARLDSKRTVIAWDMVLSPDSTEARIFEGNTCPGVNQATAQRIVDAIKGRGYDG